MTLNPSLMAKLKTRRSMVPLSFLLILTIVVTNWERWRDTTTDNMLNILATSLDPAMQQQAYDTLQQIMVTEMPSIPLVNEPYWYEYSTAHFTGWPDQNSQYAEPSPYQFPDGEIVLLNLRPV